MGEWKRSLWPFVTMILIGSLLLKSFAFNTIIVKEQGRFLKYYKSIQIKNGDSLWSIAGEYKENCQMTTEEYVNELRSMNQLKSDTIYAGQYLTIVYIEDRLKRAETR
ncbi:LysM peptidoglycan-binding domain-containing protein [Lachnospiraceae bacterium 62-35]